MWDENHCKGMEILKFIQTQDGLTLKYFQGKEATVEVVYIKLRKYLCQ